MAVKIHAPQLDSSTMVYIYSLCFHFAYKTFPSQLTPQLIRVEQSAQFSSNRCLPPRDIIIIGLLTINAGCESTI